MRAGEYKQNEKGSENWKIELKGSLRNHTIKTLNTKEKLHCGIKNTPYFGAFSRPPEVILFIMISSGMICAHIFFRHPTLFVLSPFDHFIVFCGPKENIAKSKHWMVAKVLCSHSRVKRWHQFWFIDPPTDTIWTFLFLQTLKLKGSPETTVPDWWAWMPFPQNCTR